MIPWVKVSAIQQWFTDRMDTKVTSNNAQGIVVKFERVRYHGVACQGIYVSKVEDSAMPSPWRLLEII